MRVLDSAGRHDGSQQHGWTEHLRVPDLSCGTYSLAVGAEDPQQPHTEDELYVCTSGRATLWTPSGTAEIEPGSVAFVPGGRSTASSTPWRP